MPLLLDEETVVDTIHARAKGYRPSDPISINIGT